MKDIKPLLQEALGNHLSPEGLEMVDLIPVPLSGDRLVRLRNIEDILEDFDAESEKSEGMSYIIHVRPKSALQAVASEIAGNSARDVAVSPAPKARDEKLYHPDGRLNLPYLEHNARLLLAAGEYPLARKIYQTILMSTEGSATAHYGLGLCALAENKLEEGQKFFEDSIAFEPRYETYSQLVGVLIQLNKDENAGEVAERATQLRNLESHDRFKLHQAAGNCFLRAGKMAEAERNYRAALGLDHTAEEICANLGSLYLKQGQFSDSKRYYQDAIAANPSNSNAMSGLATALYQLGDRSAAHDWFARSLEIEPKNPIALLHLVKCAYELKHYEVAERFLRNYSKIAPVNPSLLYSLAGLQYHLDRRDEARASANRVLELNPMHEGAKELLRKL